MPHQLKLANPWSRRSAKETSYHLEQTQAVRKLVKMKKKSLKDPEGKILVLLDFQKQRGKKIRK